MVPVEYLYFMKLYTSNALQLRGKYYTFYSTSLYLSAVVTTIQ